MEQSRSGIRNGTIQIRNPEWNNPDPESGMEKSRSATLAKGRNFFIWIINKQKKVPVLVLKIVYRTLKVSRRVSRSAPVSLTAAILCTQPCRLHCPTHSNFSLCPSSFYRTNTQISFRDKKLGTVLGPTVQYELIAQLVVRRLAVRRSPDMYSDFV
jgi:hypothetical protein